MGGWVGVVMVVIGGHMFTTLALPLRSIHLVCAACVPCLLSRPTTSSAPTPPFPGLCPPMGVQAVVPHINLAPFINSAPVMVRPDTPATRVYCMFISLSLRWVGLGVKPQLGCFGGVVGLLGW